MPNDRVAAVGDKDSVFAFKALGVDVFGVKDNEDAEKRIKELARTYSVIFVTENVATANAELIARYKARPYPAVIPIPTASGSNGFGMRGIDLCVEKALGRKLDEED